MPLLLLVLLPGFLDLGAHSADCNYLLLNKLINNKEYLGDIWGIFRGHSMGFLKQFDHLSSPSKDFTVKTR